MYNSAQGPNFNSNNHNLQNQQQQPSNQNTSSVGLPPLILNARLHELVLAGTGQNERLELALEHVNRKHYFSNN
jgi:hypothetical protein